MLLQYHEYNLHAIRLSRLEPALYQIPCKILMQILSKDRAIIAIQNNSLNISPIIAEQSHLRSAHKAFIVTVSTPVE